MRSFQRFQWIASTFQLILTIAKKCELELKKLWYFYFHDIYHNPIEIKYMKFSKKTGFKKS